MQDIKKIIKQATETLNRKLQQLEVLQAEKQQIIEQCQNATPDEMILLEQKMKRSEEKYKTLCDDVLEFSQKVKMLKKNFC